MGYFRRLKLSDATREECAQRCREILNKALEAETRRQLEDYMFQWACYRELLARHEGENGERLFIVGS